jgi:cytoskeletal protein RodZ
MLHVYILILEIGANYEFEHEGWIIQKSKREEVEKLIQSSANTPPPTTSVPATNEPKNDSSTTAAISSSSSSSTSSSIKLLNYSEKSLACKSSRYSNSNHLSKYPYVLSSYWFDEAS